MISAPVLSSVSWHTAGSFDERIPAILPTRACKTQPSSKGVASLGQARTRKRSRHEGGLLRAYQYQTEKLCQAKLLTPRSDRKRAVRWPSAATQYIACLTANRAKAAPASESFELRWHLR